MDIHSARGNVGPSVYRRGCLTAIVTLFSGRAWALPIYERWINVLDWRRDNLHVVALDNSADSEFSALLGQMLLRLPVGAVTLAREPRPALPGVTASDLAGSAALRSRHGYAMNVHLARLYSIARQHTPAAADFAWSVEDDIEPPPHALTELARGLYLHPQAGACNGLVRHRSFEGLNHGGLIAWGAGGWEQDPVREAPGEGEFLAVGATGFGCALFRGDVWRRQVFRPALELGTERWSSYDWAACDFVRSRLGKQWLLAGGVSCKHHEADGRAV